MNLCRRVGGTAMSLLLAVPGMVGTASADADDPFKGHRVVSREVLENLRGGFVGNVGGNNLELSFGIEHAVFVNGQLVVSTRLTIPNVGSPNAQGERFISNVAPNGAAAPASVAAGQPAATQLGSAQITPTQATAPQLPAVQLTNAPLQQVSIKTVQTPAGQLNLVQIGPGNSFALSQLPAGVLNVIQNSLNNQKIGQVTTIQVSANSLGLLRAMNLGAAINQQISRAVR